MEPFSFRNLFIFYELRQESGNKFLVKQKNEIIRVLIVFGYR